MFIPGKRPDVIPGTPYENFKTESTDPWKDEAYTLIKSENLSLRQQLDKLTQALLNLSTGKPNFLKDLKSAGLSVGESFFRSQAA
jgi:hypothetical protein